MLMRRTYMLDSIQHTHSAYLAGGHMLKVYACCCMGHVNASDGCVCSECTCSILPATLTSSANYADVLQLAFLPHMLAADARTMLLLVAFITLLLCSSSAEQHIAHPICPNHAPRTRNRFGSIEFRSCSSTPAGHMLQQHHTRHTLQQTPSRAHAAAYTPCMARPRT